VNEGLHTGGQRRETYWCPRNSLFVRMRAVEIRMGGRGSTSQILCRLKQAACSEPGPVRIVNSSRAVQCCCTSHDPTFCGARYSRRDCKILEEAILKYFALLLAISPFAEKPPITPESHRRPHIDSQFGILCPKFWIPFANPFLRELKVGDLKREAWSQLGVIKSALIKGRTRPGWSWRDRWSRHFYPAYPSQKPIVNSSECP